MEYRRFGKTNLSMPVISLGGMRFQTSWKREDTIREDSVAQLERIVARALDLGINHVETAFGYGTSEAELGRVLPALDRSRLILQTKGGPSGDVATFRQNFETSLVCLGVDWLDLFAVHGINNDAILAEVLQPGGVLDQVEAYRRQGLVRSVGFSTHGPTSTIVKAIETGRFDYVNLWYSYILQDNWPAIRAAHERDMGVFIISPNDKGGQLYAPPERLRRLCAPLAPMAVNDLFILAHPEIHTLSCGAARPEDLDEHVRAAARRAELAETVAGIVGRLDACLDAVYGPDWATGYRQGVPTWENTPGQVNIPVILWLWNLVQAFDLRDFARVRYNLMGNAEHWFPGRRADGLAQLDLEALNEALAEAPFRERILDILGRAQDVLGGDEVQRLSAAP